MNHEGRIEDRGRELRDGGGMARTEGEGGRGTRVRPL